jgi:hypothetical protein
LVNLILLLQLVVSPSPVPPRLRALSSDDLSDMRRTVKFRVVDREKGRTGCRGRGGASEVADGAGSVPRGKGRRDDRH